MGARVGISLQHGINRGDDLIQSVDLTHCVTHIVMWSVVDVVVIGLPRLDLVTESAAVTVMPVTVVLNKVYSGQW